MHGDSARPSPDLPPDPRDDKTPRAPAATAPVGTGPSELQPGESWLIWFLAGALLAAAIALVAFSLQQLGFAPAVLFPLAVGGALGAGLNAIRRRLRLPTARAAVISAVVWGLLVVVGQDYIGHRRRAAALADQLATHGPAGMLAATRAGELQPRFADHLVAVARRRPIWWTLELVLTAGSAGLVTGWLARRDAQLLSNAT